MGLDDSYMRKKFASPGFTLIEALLVISVIAIVTALSLPRLSGASSQRELDMVAQNLASDIRLAQQININSGGLSEKRSQILFFLDKNGHYYFVSANGAKLKTVYLPKTIKFVSTKTIQFTVTGAPATVSGTSSAQTLSLKNSDGKMIYIKIAPVTGRVRITDIAGTGDG